MNQTAIDRTFRAGVAALALVASLAACAANPARNTSREEPAQATPPCTYVGRLMDAEHVGFDTNRVAEISAYDASGKLVATAKTFYKPNSRRNYALRIPMASKAVDGGLAPGSTVRIEVTVPKDTYDEVWSGVVVELDSQLSGPGTVKEVDIVLAECSNEYGIDDYLYDDLYWAWYYSPYGPYYVPGATFNPLDDHDGDGMSTRDEVLAGTNPFNSNDALSIISFVRGGQGNAEKDRLSFRCRPGRAYRLEVTESLNNPNWQTKAFYKDESGTPINYISVPAVGSSEETPTVYLLPEVGKSAFFRIKAD